MVVGVHTPEFGFEKETNNVRDAIARNHLQYPVAQDNDYGTWDAWGNQYWPAKYLVDATGQVRYTHFGEGDYATTEVPIRTLLAEAGARTSARAPATSRRAPRRRDAGDLPRHGASRPLGPAAATAACTTTRESHGWKTTTSRSAAAGPSAESAEAVGDAHPARTRARQVGLPRARLEDAAARRST